MEIGSKVRHLVESRQGVVERIDESGVFVRWADTGLAGWEYKEQLEEITPVSAEQVDRLRRKIRRLLKGVSQSEIERWRLGNGEISKSAKA